MKKVSLVALIASTTFAYNGENFFINTAPLLWEGTKDIRFQQKPEKVVEILNANMGEIQAFAKKYDVNKKLEVWIDSTSTTRYFLSTYVRKIDYQIVNAKKAGCPWSDVTAGRLGLRNVFVGNRDSNYVLMCFTFYNGSKIFKRDVKSEFVETESIKGLFSWSINMDGFKSEYLNHLLNDVGYGRGCGRQHSYNCQIKDFDKAGGEIVTTDKDAYTIWRKDGDLLNVRFKANYVSTFPAALKANLSNWVISNQFKHPALD